MEAFQAASLADESAGSETQDYELKASLASKVNLADFQNAVPLLRELRVINNSEADLAQVWVQVTSQPASTACA